MAHSQPPEEYRVMVHGAGITHAAAIAVAPAGDLERTRTRNDAVLTLSAGSGGFFLPVCSVHPADGEAALAELDRVAAAGCRWLKLHPMMQAFDLADPPSARWSGVQPSSGFPSCSTPTSRSIRLSRVSS